MIVLLIACPDIFQTSSHGAIAVAVKVAAVCVCVWLEGSVVVQNTGYVRWDVQSKRQTGCNSILHPTCELVQICKGLAVAWLWWLCVGD